MKRALPLLILGLLLYLIAALSSLAVEGFEPTPTPTLPRVLGRAPVTATPLRTPTVTPTRQPTATRVPAVMRVRYEVMPTLIPTPEPTLVPLPRPKGCVP
jgi:hypothetical protein